MNLEQSAYLQMCSAVRATNVAHATAWSGLPAFVSAQAKLINLLQRADQATGLQSTRTQGATEGKETLRDTAENLTLQLASALVLHGKQNNKPQLVADARTTAADLYNMSEKKLAGHIQKLLSLTVGLPSSWLPPGIPATIVENLTSAALAFTTAIGTPRHMRAESVRGGQELKAVIEALHDLFENEMDPAADVLQFSQPAFYSEYRTSREIIDPSYNVRSLQVVITDEETGQPLAGVEASINPGAIQKVTSGKGGFYITRLVAGTYTMTLSLSGYATKTVIFNVVDGQRTEVEETLEVAGVPAPPVG